jgi:hypothetical protein
VALENGHYKWFTDNGGLKSTDQCSVTVNDSNSGIDLTGFWLTLKHTSKGRNHWIQGTLEVENLGNQTAPSSFVRFYHSTDNVLDGTDVLIGERLVTVLEPGQAVKVPLKKKISSLVPDSYVIATVDATGLVSEADETNNIIVSWSLN